MRAWQRKATWLLVATAAWAVLALAGPTYACVPQPFIAMHPLGSGAAGSQVNVDGQLFDNGTRIEIRWNATDGPLLGTAQSADFSVPVSIPSVAPGLYTVLALTRDPAGVQGSVARAEFLITGASQPSTTAVASAGSKRGTNDSSGGVSFASVSAAVGLVALGLIGGTMLSGRRTRRHPAETPSSTQ